LFSNIQIHATPESEIEMEIGWVGVL